MNRFEGLIERFEKSGASAAVSGSSSTASSAPAKVAEAPATGGAASASGDVTSFIPDFKARCFKNVPELKKLTAELKVEQMVAGVDLHLEMLNSMEAVLTTMQQCSKPADMNFMMEICKVNKKKNVEL